MKCVNCGNEMPDNSKFCSNCGTQQPMVNTALSAQSNYQNAQMQNMNYGQYQSNNQQVPQNVKPSPKNNKIIKTIAICIIVFVALGIIGNKFIAPNLGNDTGDSAQSDSSYDSDSSANNNSSENNPVIEQYLENNYSTFNDSLETLKSDGDFEMNTLVRGDSVVISVNYTVEIENESLAKELLETSFIGFESIVSEMQAECSEIESLIIECYTVNGDLLYYEEFK